jgi:hypothetical protein
MSSSGQGQQRPVTSTSASESASHSVRRHPPRRFVGRIRAHNGCEQPQQITKLLDHLVGACEQRGRDGEAERLRGLDIDDKLEFGRLFDRQIAGIGALRILSATEDNPGTISFSSWRRLPLRSVATMLSPVAFPPGRQRL